MKFKIGDHVRWNSEAGRVTGKIIAIHTRNFQYKGYTHHASEDDPQYEIKSDKSDHIAAHKGGALEHIRGKGKASGTNPDFAELTRRLGFEYNGMILHEYYFSNLKKGADPAPASSSGLAQALNSAFPSIDKWKEDFQAIGGMRGIGWVILFEDPATHQLSNHWVSMHQNGIPAGFKPLLVMDVWEHAFMRDYKATEKAKYVEAFFRNIDWQAVERRLREASAVRPAAAA